MGTQHSIEELREIVVDIVAVVVGIVEVVLPVVASEGR